MEETKSLKCHWCENPEPLEVFGPSKWCKICFRYSHNQTPEGLDSHACVMETILIGKDPESIHSVLYKCTNPVRANFSPEYLSTQNRCNKRFTLTKTEYDSGQTKEVMALEVHSWSWYHKTREEWSKKIPKEARSLLSPEEIRNHPKYVDFLKFQETTKV